MTSAPTEPACPWRRAAAMSVRSHQRQQLGAAKPCPCCHTRADPRWHDLPVEFPVLGPGADAGSAHHTPSASATEHSGRVRRARAPGAGHVPLPGEPPMPVSVCPCNTDLREGPGADPKRSPSSQRLEPGGTRSGRRSAPMSHAALALPMHHERLKLSHHPDTLLLRARPTQYDARRASDAPAYIRPVKPRVVRSTAAADNGINATP